MRDANEDRRKRVWDRLDTPTKVIAAVAGSIAALAGAVTAGAALFSHDKTLIVQPSVGSAAPNAPQRIAGCIRRHRLGAPRVSVGISGGGITYPRHSAIFKRCDWPPLTPGSRDGYTEVRVQDVDLPKPAAAPYNTLGTFRAQCDQLDVTFVLDHMLARLFTSKRLDLSRIYEVGGAANGSLRIRQLNQVPSDVMSFVPLPTATPPTFYVLYSGHFALFDAHCAAGRPPA
jgi:hypothetical protein